jgi:hypothetical protein
VVGESEYSQKPHMHASLHYPRKNCRNITKKDNSMMIPAEMSKILSEAFLEFESSIPVLFFILFIILEQRVGFSDSAGRVLF